MIINFPRIEHAPAPQPANDDDAPVNFGLRGSFDQSPAHSPCMTVRGRVLLAAVATWIAIVALTVAGVTT